MIKHSDGSIYLELNSRIGAINLDGTTRTFISEDDFKNALKGFRLLGALTALGSLSNKIYGGEIPNGWERLGKGLIRQKETGLLISQSMIEYLENLFIISGSNDFKTLSITEKDNLLGLFNIYQHSLVIGSIQRKNVISIMVSLWQEQLRTQANDLQSIGRTIYMFQKLDREIIKNQTLTKILHDNSGLTIEEYLNAALVLLACALVNPIIIIGDLSSDSINFQKIINNSILERFLILFSATYDEFRSIDSTQNIALAPKDTRNRFNPLWKKPLIKFSESKFLVPSIPTYIQAAFNGLFWWFDDLFMKKQFGHEISKTTFREIFGKEIFEQYVGLILGDIFGDSHLTPEIIYGGKGKKAFTDWVVVDGDDAYLVEVKAYQFPFKTLQTGDLEMVAHEIAKKLTIDTIQKLDNKILDINTSAELNFLKGKNLIPVVITYNVPLIDTNLYRHGMKDILDNKTYKIFSEFNGYFLNIADLESFKLISKATKLKNVLLLARTNNSNFYAEITKILKSGEGPWPQSLPERQYHERMDYITTMLGSDKLEKL